MLALSPLDAALLVGCEDGSLHRVQLIDEVIGEGTVEVYGSYLYKDN